MSEKILITGHVPKNILEEFGNVARITPWTSENEYLMPVDQLYDKLANYDALVNFAEVMVGGEFVSHARNLKIISNASIGYDNLDIPLLTSHKIWAAHAPGHFSYPVAEYVLACILNLLRKINEADRFVRSSQWKSFEPGRWDGVSFREKTLGIVGMGIIGSELRMMSQSLGTNVIYYDPVITNLQGWVSFDELMATSDIISIHIPLTKKTQQLFNTDIFMAMKQGAILVNAARGGIVDLKALARALQFRKLSGAILDVFENEPIVPDELKKMENVIITPHMAGGTLRARENCLRHALQNVIEVFKGNPPLNPLNQIQ